MNFDEKASQTRMPLVIIGDMPSTSVSASSQQAHVFPTREQALRITSATATNNACNIRLPDSAVPWPQLQQSKPPEIDSIQHPLQQTWKLRPVVQSSKASRLKRKHFNTGMAGAESGVTHREANIHRLASTTPCPCNDPQGISTDAKSHTSKAMMQLAAKTPVQAVAANKSGSSGSDHTWCPESNQVLSEPPVPSVGGSQPEPACSMLDTAAQEADVPTNFPCDLDHICCNAQQAQEAQQVQEAQQLHQTPEAQEAQQLHQTPEAQEVQRKLTERAKQLQTLVDQLQAEAQAAAPRTVEEVQKEVQRQEIVKHIHRLSPQQRQALAKKAKRSVQVPVQVPNCQAGEVALRCQGMAVRDCALPLQDGHLMCPEARPCMATLQEVHEAAACQHVVTADVHEEDVDIEDCRGNPNPLPLTAASDTSVSYAIQEVWGVPDETGHMRGPQPVKNTVKTMVDMAQQGTYHAFLSDRQKRSSHHPRGTSQAMQGLFALMTSFESITDPAVQKQLLEYSSQLLDLSQGSRVRLLCHEARSAGQLLGLLRDHAPETLQDDHLLMLRGPFQDMDQRQAGMVRNPGVRLKCDQQSPTAWFRSQDRTSASTADFCDAGGAGELAVKALFPHMHQWALNLQVEWGLRADDPLEYSCVVEALMAAWVRGDLPSPAPQAAVPYAHQVDVSKWESALGPEQVGAGPSMYASPSAPLPCHGSGARGEHTIAAGFAYTPESWSSASATALACSDDGCGATMAQHSAAQQATSNLTGVNSGLAILSSLFTRTNFHIEDTLLGAYNVMSLGAPKIWYVVPAESATLFEAALQEQQGECLAQLTAKHLYCSLSVQLLKQLGVRRFLQMPGYAVLTYPGAVYHWTISSGFSLAEASNLYVGPLHSMLPNMRHWYALIHAACTQAVKQNHAGLTDSLLLRVNISQAIVQVLLEGPLQQHKSPSLHRQALGVLHQLHTLHNFLDG